MGFELYTKEDICAVVISFNADKKLLKNVASLLKQVTYVVIIDNKSTSEQSVKILREIEQSGVNVLYDKENLGIATQLNKGLKLCLEFGCSLMLSMDQDTILFDNCVKEMLKVMNENVNIVSVGPNRKQMNESGNNYRIVNYLITSGNLTQVKCANECGGYFDDLFIDLIDIDFSLTLRRQGYQLAMVNNAFMSHKVGEYESSKILGHTLNYLTHSAKRFYYIYRNNIIVFRKFFCFCPIYCLKMEVFQIKEFIKFLLIEKNKKKKLSMIRHGIKDGIGYKFEISK